MHLLCMRLLLSDISASFSCFLSLLFPFLFFSVSFTPFPSILGEGEGGNYLVLSFFGPSLSAINNHIFFFLRGQGCVSPHSGNRLWRD